MTHLCHTRYIEAFFRIFMSTQSRDLGFALLTSLVIVGVVSYAGRVFAEKWQVARNSELQVQERIAMER